MLLLRAIYVIFIEISILYYTTEMPLYLEACPQKVVILLFQTEIYENPMYEGSG